MLYMTVVQLFQVMEDRLLVAEKECESKPKSKLPSENELIPAVSAEEYTRVSNRESESYCNEQGHNHVQLKITCETLLHFQKRVQVLQQSGSGST